MSEQDTQDGNVSRRKVLAGTGSAIATLGVSRVAGANVDDADKIEIPATGQGGEVIRYNTVPKEWWNHILAARRQSSKLAENIPEAAGVAKEATDDTIAGRKKRELVVEFPDEVARKNARVPEKAGGFPIKTEITADFEPGSCKNIINDPYFHGGAYLKRQDNSPKLGTCYDTGYAEALGTAGCYAEIGSTTDLILTASHLFDPNNNCDNIANIPAATGVDNNGHTDRNAGYSTYYQSGALDFMFIRNNTKYCWQGKFTPLPVSTTGKMYQPNGTIEIKGYTLNLDQYTGTSTTFYRPTHRSGYQSGTLDRDGISTSYNCVNNNNMFEFTLPSTSGDSGGVYYREWTDPRDNKTYAEVSALHTGHDISSTQVGNVNCTYPVASGTQTTQYNKARATSAEDIQNDLPQTVYYGGK